MKKVPREQNAGEGTVRDEAQAGGQRKCPQHWTPKVGALEHWGGQRGDAFNPTHQDPSTVKFVCMDQIWCCYLNRWDYPTTDRGRQRTLREKEPLKGSGRAQSNSEITETIQLKERKGNVSGSRKERGNVHISESWVDHQKKNGSLNK